jgi:hypothetical protein
MGREVKMYGKCFKWVFTLGLATAIGCGSGGDERAHESSGVSRQALQAAPADACQRVFSIELPPNFTSSQIVLGATDSLALSDRVTLANPNGQGAPTASNMGTGSLTIGTDATSGSLFARGPVSLGDRTQSPGFHHDGGAGSARQPDLGVRHGVRARDPDTDEQIGLAGLFSCHQFG